MPESTPKEGQLPPQDILDFFKNLTEREGFAIGWYGIPYQEDLQISISNFADSTIGVSLDKRKYRPYYPPRFPNDVLGFKYQFVSEGDHRRDSYRYEFTVRLKSELGGEIEVTSMYPVGLYSKLENFQNPWLQNNSLYRPRGPIISFDPENIDEDYWFDPVDRTYHYRATSNLEMKIGEGHEKAIFLAESEKIAAGPPMRYPIEGMTKQDTQKLNRLISLLKSGYRINPYTNSLLSVSEVAEFDIRMNKQMASLMKVKKDLGLALAEGFKVVEIEYGAGDDGNFSAEVNPKP